ncbi:M23 family metallopeptidase [Streptomyces sp. NPDC058045]|uniref:M23 family metallopeptidase n=1 Tax=Streptomyces sp. NPDC058045 TaxID=3346311 RepID=UPI0036E41B7A
MVRGSRGSGDNGDLNGSGPPVARTWPLAAPPHITRGWDPPTTPYGPGHRGIDLTAPTDTPVLAIAAGHITYAGQVAGHGVVTVTLDHTGDPPVHTTYQPVHPTVHKGDLVTAGQQIATLDPGTGHCPGPCLHWGARRGLTYVNPLTLLPPWLLNPGHPRLLPLPGAPASGGPGAVERRMPGPGSGTALSQRGGRG